MRTSPWAVALFGILNATLYCLLLPLWEGFDEPFHYGYVQTLSAKGELPVLGKTRLSREVLQSLHLAPASRGSGEATAPPRVIELDHLFQQPGEI